MKSKHVFFVILATVFCLAVYLIWQDRSRLTVQLTPIPVASLQPSPQPLPTPIVSTISAVLGMQVQFENCTIENALPDPDCSPGAIFPNITKDDICTSGYTKKVRDVSSATKKKVYVMYGMPYPPQEEYEVDHIISLELGGSNEISNLWPEAAEPRPGFHEKDKVENYLHKQVCEGKISLSEAQRLINREWVQVYQSLN